MVLVPFVVVKNEKVNLIDFEDMSVVLGGKDTVVQ